MIPEGYCKTKVAFAVEKPNAPMPSGARPHNRVPLSSISATPVPPPLSEELTKRCQKNLLGKSNIRFLCPEDGTLRAPESKIKTDEKRTRREKLRVYWFGS
jgi:hypothetical protein